mmetsp:Transcript_88734/g.237389  ORF Transcript_88734/g.237389 Transcript_88734/m.237389 type:complete len:140 (+) Transcript_88734:505-924(+)
MRKVPRVSAEGLVETNFLGREQVGAFSFEHVVFLFLHNKVDISRFHAGDFVRHAAKGNFLIVLHAFFNEDFQALPFRLGLCLRALSFAIGTSALHLRNHAGSNLSDFHNGSLSLAFGTGLDFPDNDFAVDGQLDGFSHV